MKKKETDLWLTKSRVSGKIKVTTIVVPPSPAHSNDEDDDTNPNVDSNNNTSPTSKNTESNAQPSDVCTSPSDDTHTYTRNRSTTRSWPVIHRNTSLSNPQNYLEPHVTTKAEQLYNKSEQRQRKSTHQYDFDQIFGLNNANYQQYLASHRKSSIFDIGPVDKSPSIYDLQHLNHDQPSKEQSSFCCSPSPAIIFLLFTLVVTTVATGMLSCAIMTDHWENVVWEKEALRKIVNQSESSKVTKELEFLLDGKVARLPFKSE